MSDSSKGQGAGPRHGYGLCKCPGPPTVLQFEYMIPVSVIVDLDEGSITRVIVWDEALVNPKDYDRVLCDYCGERVRPRIKKAVAQAEEILERDDLWPAWKFGR